MKKIVIAVCLTMFLAAPASASVTDEDKCMHQYLKSLNKVIKIYVNAIDAACRKDLSSAEIDALGTKIKAQLDRVATKYNNRTANLSCDADLDDVGNMLNFAGQAIAELDTDQVMLPWADPANTADIINAAIVGCDDDS